MNFNELEIYISTDRLATYTTLIGCTDLDKAVGAYYWNKALGGAVYSFLQCLEVSLRNSMHIAGRNKFHRETWYEHVCKTVGNDIRRQRRTTTLTTENEKKINEAIAKLRRDGKVVSSSNVISTLMFGFWVKLFKRDFSSTNQSLLWPELLFKVFPNAPRTQSLQVFYDELTEINMLRNRFSHHEPLWKSGTILTIDDAILFLNEQITKIMDYVRYVNFDRAKMLQNSTAYKEFKGLNRRDTFDVFVGDTKKILTMQQFKSDLNLHLKQVCDSHKMIFVKRNSNAVAKVCGY